MMDKNILHTKKQEERNDSSCFWRRIVKLSATPLRNRPLWCFVAKALPRAQVQLMVLPLDVILWRIRDVFALRKELP